MNKEFVPYDIALALKELGFDEPCVGTYHDNGQKGAFTFGMFQFPKRNSQANTVSGTFIGEQGCYSPTYSQAFRFFRDEYECYYYIEPIWRNSKIRYEWCVDNTANSEKDWREEQICITYEEAELECLKKLIEIVKTE